jgi:hypothetical protein
MALGEHAGAVGCGERELEAVGDLPEAIFNGDAGHGAVPLSKVVLRVLR